MNDSELGFGGVLFVAVIIMGYFLWQQSKQIDALNQALAWANSNIDALNYEIGQANDDIASLNNQIDEAQSYAWSDYDTMGYALENLSAVGDSFETYPTVSSSTSN